MISGEVYFSDLFIEEKIDRQGNITLTTSQGGLIWILAGDVYNIPTNAEVVVVPDQIVQKNDILATTEIISDYGGTVRLIPNLQDEIQIITASTSIENSYIGVNKDLSTPETPYFLELENGKRFLMHCSPGNKITNSQTIAELIDESYTTSTGGFITYSNSDSCRITKHKRGYEVVEDLVLYWVPEETHEINKDISLLMVNNGEMVNEHHELIKDLYTVNSGFLSILEENGIVKEISIKPGYLHPIKDTSSFVFEARVYEPDELVYKDFKVEAVSFIERVDNELGRFLLIRPVIEYKVTQSHPYLKQTLTNDTHTILQIDVVQRILVRDGEKVKSFSPVNLLKTYLVLNIISDLPHLSADVEFIPLDKEDYCQLKLIVLESLSIRKDTFGEVNKGFTISQFTVNNGEKITAGTRVAQTKLLCRSGGEVKSIYINNRSTRNILIYTEGNKKVIPIPGKTSQVSKGDLVRYGDQIAEGVIVEKGAVISMGVYIGASTKIIDRESGEIFYGRVPAYSVVVPGNIQTKNNLSLYAAIIVKKVDEKTRSKTSINELLRD